MKKTFDINNDDDGLSYYYGEWHISGELRYFLADIINRKFRITIETIDDEQEEEFVTLTYRELFKRASDKVLCELGVNYYYLNEGGDPTNIIDIPRSIALAFMGEEEFNHRKV